MNVGGLCGGFVGCHVVFFGCVVINRETLFVCLKGRSEEIDNEVLLSNTKGAGVCARSIE